MKPVYVASLFLLIGGVAKAVYAPIPEAAKGKALMVSLGGGVGYDSNIFGAATNEIESMVWRIAPAISYNASLTDQTFFSAAYDLAFDYVEDRPQNQELFSHNAMVRLAHAFSPRTSIDLVENFSIAENPESLLAGVPLNTDQSFKRNQFDGRLVTALSERLGLTVKGRSVVYAYDNDNLADDLDRAETLLGLEGELTVRPGLQAVGEYRYQDISYAEAGGAKNKESHFLLAGADYAVAETVSASARLGVEFRQRAGAEDTEAPYVELSGRRALGENGFVAAGFVYTLEEASNVSLYTDTEVRRWFVNAQYPLSARIVLSGMLTYEPSVLQGRPGVNDDTDETTVRAGAAVSYLAAKGWLVSLTADQDSVYSDDANRDLERTRFGVNARRDF